MSRTYEQLAPVISALDERIKTNSGAFLTDTAEGSIVSFPDGADGIPLKSLVVDINPVQDTSSGDPSPENICPISGWSEVNVSQSGKFNAGAEYGSGDGFVQSAVLKADNTTAENPVYFVTAYFPITPDSDCLVDAVGVYNMPAICFYDASKTFISGVSYANRRRFIVHTPSNCAYARMTIYTTNAYASGAYDNCTSITIPLGQTVYGGHLDVLSGVLTVDRAMVDLGTLNWSYTTNYTRFSATVGDIKSTSSNYTVANNLICSQYTPTYANKTADESGNNMVAIGMGTSVFVRDESYTDAASFKAATDGVQLVYELATPITIQLTPHEVRSLLGQNNILADTGDSAVEYRADTKMYIERLTEPDADMIADANIVSGSYFMVGNTLYKATANIASGSAVIVGTNCTQKSLSEALNEINQ